MTDKPKKKPKKKHEPAITPPERPKSAARTVLEKILPHLPDSVLAGKPMTIEQHEPIAFQFAVCPICGSRQVAEICPVDGHRFEATP